MPRSSRVFASESMARWMAADDRLGAMLAEDHRREPYDVVVCQQIFAVNVARSVPDVPMVLDEHNVESRAMVQVLASFPRARIPAGFPTDASAVEAYEGEVWPRAALITCTTDSDAAWIGGRSGVPVRVIPNGADVDETPLVLPSARHGHDILFVGAFFWPPNIRAARFLAKEVLPRVRAGNLGRDWSSAASPRAWKSPCSAGMRSRSPAPSPRYSPTCGQPASTATPYSRGPARH